MKVSVLIPAYNSEKEIYTCIRSLLEQTYHDFEVIAVDDGSTDRTGSRSSIRKTAASQRPATRR